ncbi:Crp/Fnr family transcriptional regulator [Geobacter sp. SVR]|uniref:Crp/Fnr family transcriptional regulator n=1 Tax=Geobacter sp. SVR TaxID=2495594 RepID=UPI00143EFA13|nr:Crp/Fnr family transcriptional regulator [Geobacter sp. SVR]BCS55109.1 CarD family transcriptional regulator [Geobacter sp. SVR]GCF85290.1 CarD family transcriptional regulator [Geobacter sp. SVR]
MELIELLKKSLLFSGLADGDLAELATITVRRKFKKGEALFSEGDVATGFYLLVVGSIKLCRIAPDGREKVLHFVRAGETFAEAAFFGDGKYPAEARALEAGEVLYLPKQGFMELMARNPNFSLNLVISLSLMLRQFARQIEELSFADVTSRLASFLVRRADEKSTSYGGITYIDLGIKKGELASRLGTASETVSRTLRKLKDEGIIEVQGNRVVIHQMEKLQKLCERHE